MCHDLWLEQRKMRLARRYYPSSAHSADFVGECAALAVDRTDYAYAAFHRDFMRGKVTMVGCHKLDPVGYFVTEEKPEV